MSLTLAIDCSMRWLNLGVADCDRIYGEENMNVGNRQSELLPDSAERLLGRFGMSFADLGRIAVTLGPGYYTGIRVGLSYATALAESLSIGVVPVTTLEVVAFGPLRSGLLAAPVLGMRSDSLYGALYEGSLKTALLPEGFYENDDFVERLERSGHSRKEILVLPVFGTGSSPSEVADRLGGMGYPVLSVTPATGLALSLLSLERKPVDPATVKAEYMHLPSVGEKKKDGSHKKL